MKTSANTMRIFGKRTLAAVMAAASLCAAGCGKKVEDDTFVMIDVGYIDSEQEYLEKYGADGTYVAISGFTTPQPVVTPLPTPEPTPEPTRRPKATEKPKSESKEVKEEKEEKEESKPTPTPKPKGVGKTPYSSKYEKVSISYESSSEGISFETTTLDGEAVSDSLFGRNGITMVNIWTQT
ncbi:MAG: hypothetical protein IJB30_05615 [Clostridia bacterium]|nr:hypothetical protein [Clostridia bacterium]